MSGSGGGETGESGNLGNLLGLITWEVYVFILILLNDKHQPLEEKSPT